MTATILSGSTLKDITFNYKNSEEQNTGGQVSGKLETSNRSPYKGTVSYSLKSGDVLILPPNLSNQNLTAVAKVGISKFYKNENAVIIGYSTDPDAGEAGGHYSIRMICSSNL